jgi:hypothetical protein
MRENYVVNATKFYPKLCVIAVMFKLMPKCQAFIVHYMTLHMRESTPFDLNQCYGSLNTFFPNVMIIHT